MSATLTSIGAKVTALGFGIYLLLPLGRFLSEPAPQSSSSEAPPPQHPEPPRPPALPALAPLLPSSTNTWLDDFKENYGFRKQLIDRYSFIRVKWFRSSTHEEVRLGRGDWLFFAGGGVLNYHRQAFPWSEVELKIWADALVSRQAWLKSKGARYIFVVAPDKHSIYGRRYLPHVSWAPHTRLDQLLGYLEAHHPDLEVVDLRKPVAELAKTTLAFHRTDTHYNGMAGWVSSQAILEKLGLAEESKVAPEVIRRTISGGDLSRMLGVQKHVQDTAVEPKLSPVPLYNPFDRTRTPLSFQLHDIVPRGYVAIHNPKTWRRALVFRDSFGEALIPYLSRAFGRTTWVWSFDVDQNMVTSHRPHVVFSVIAERQLMVVQPTPLPAAPPKPKPVAPPKP